MFLLLHVINITQFRSCSINTLELTHVYISYQKETTNQNTKAEKFIPDHTRSLGYSLLPQYTRNFDYPFDNGFRVEFIHETPFNASYRIENIILSHATGVFMCTVITMSN